MAIPVTVPDAGLRRALESNGLKLDGKEVAARELEKLSDLEWSEDGVGEADPDGFMPVSDLTGLEHAPNLRSLGLGGSRVRTLAPLAGHPALEELWVNHNALVDISAVRGMKRLRVAVFDGNAALEDASALADAPELTYVNLSGTKVSDLTALGRLTHLRKPSFFGLQVAAGSPSFEVLVALGLRGAELQGDAALLLEIRVEVDRRRAEAAAKQRAASSTPAPRGPTRRYACTGRLAARRNWSTACAWPGMRLQ